MDQPQLNLLFGLGLILTVEVNVSLCVMLSKILVFVGMAVLRWLAAALYTQSLFLQLTASAFNMQISIGLVAIGSIGALVILCLWSRFPDAGLTSVLLFAQMLVSMVSQIFAFGLHRRMVPVSPL